MPDPAMPTHAGAAGWAERNRAGSRKGAQGACINGGATRQCATQLDRWRAAGQDHFREDLGREPAGNRRLTSNFPVDFAWRRAVSGLSLARHDPQQHRIRRSNLPGFPGGHLLLGFLQAHGADRGVVRNPATTAAGGQTACPTGRWTSQAANQSRPKLIRKRSTYQNSSATLAKRLSAAATC